MLFLLYVVIRLLLCVQRGAKYVCSNEKERACAQKVLNESLNQYNNTSLILVVYILLLPVPCKKEGTLVYSRFINCHTCLLIRIIHVIISSPKEKLQRQRILPEKERLWNILFPIPHQFIKKTLLYGTQDYSYQIQRQASRRPAESKHNPTRRWCLNNR